MAAQFRLPGAASPGVVPAEPGARDAANGGFSANGVRSNGQNNFLLNGVDNNINTIDFLNQTAYAIGPSVEAISEMNMITNGYNAEYGRAAGGVVNVNLKSGTNSTARQSVRDTAEQGARRQSLGEQSGRRAARSVRRRISSARLPAAPIIKNKLFIFGDYQGTRIATSGGAVADLGYAGFMHDSDRGDEERRFLERAGRRHRHGPDHGRHINQGAIYDPQSTVYQNANGVPVSRTPFPGNIIPQNRWDPAFAKILSLYPATNQPIKTGTFPAQRFLLHHAGRARRRIRATAAWTITSATRTACSVR